MPRPLSLLVAVALYAPLALAALYVASNIVA
jgi:hypothetical protein